MQIADDFVFHIIFSALDIPKEGLATQPNTSFRRSTPLHYRYHLLVNLLDWLSLMVARIYPGHLLDYCHTPLSTERIVEACPYVVAGKVSSLVRHQPSGIDLLHPLSIGFQNNRRLLVSQSVMILEFFFVICQSFERFVAYAIVAWHACHSGSFRQNCGWDCFITFNLMQITASSTFSDYRLLLFQLLVLLWASLHLQS
jgi:hypothetical protein